MGRVWPLHQRSLDDSEPSIHLEIFSATGDERLSVKVTSARRLVAVVAENGK